MRAASFTKNTDADNYSCFRYDIRFDPRSVFLLSRGAGFPKNKMIEMANLPVWKNISNKFYCTCW